MSFPQDPTADYRAVLATSKFPPQVLAENDNNILASNQSQKYLPTIPDQESEENPSANSLSLSLFTAFLFP